MTTNKNLSFKKIKKIYHEEVKAEQLVIEENFEQLEVLPELAPIVEVSEPQPEPKIEVIEGSENLVNEFLSAIGAKNLVEVVSAPAQPKVKADASAFVDPAKLDDFLKNIQEETPPAPIVEQTPTLVTPVTKQVVDLTKPVASNKPKIDPNIKAINDRLGLFERRLGDLAMRPMGQDPGGGETKFRFLDDVNRSTMNDSNNNWVLEYDSNTKKSQFTEHIGQIRSVKFNTTGPQQALVAGQMAYNEDEDCFDFKHNDGTTLQGGLEQHIRVHNHLETTVTNGTVVMFAGVENTNAVAMPIVGKYLADSTVIPLLIIGVMTTDIVPGGTGRATTFGYVRDLNTTGSDVGETWLQGDLLWGHPTIAGKMTKVKPTAPNVVTSIAAVVRVGTTDGQLLVRPTIFPRLFYGSFSDTTDQTAAAINTPYAIKFNTTDIASGHSIVNNTQVVAANSGLYNYQFSLQLSSSNSSSKEVYIWARKNGVDIPNSSTRVTITGNGIYAAVAWNFVVSMDANQYFELMWAVSDLTARIVAPAATAFCPAVPSAILTVTEAAL